MNPPPPTHSTTHLVSPHSPAHSTQPAIDLSYAPLTYSPTDPPTHLVPPSPNHFPPPPSIQSSPGTDPMDEKGHTHDREADDGSIDHVLQLRGGFRLPGHPGGVGRCLTCDGMASQCAQQSIRKSKIRTILAKMRFLKIRTIFFKKKSDKFGQHFFKNSDNFGQNAFFGFLRLGSFFVPRVLFPFGCLGLPCHPVGVGLRLPSDGMATQLIGTIVIQKCKHWTIFRRGK